MAITSNCPPFSPFVQDDLKIPVQNPPLPSLSLSGRTVFVNKLFNRNFKDIAEDIHLPAVLVCIW